MSASGAAHEAATPSDRSFTIALSALALVALAIRLWQASRTELWFDEVFTLWIARMDWHGLVATAARDVHPPLHFAIVKLWRGLGGESSFWIKLTSVIPGVALVVTIATLGRSMFGARAGLIAAALVAMHGDQVMVAQEARAYVWLALSVWLAVGSAWRWVRDGRIGDGIGVVLAEALGLWSHYLAGAMFACLFVWGVVALLRTPRRIGHWIGLHLAVAALFAPQLPTFIAQMRRQSGDHWVRHVSWGSLFTLARHTAFASTVLLAPFMVLATLPLARRGERKAASLVWSLVLPVVGVMFAITMAGGHLFTERYMHWIMPGMCLVAAAGLAGLRTRWLAWVLVTAFVVQGARVIAASPDPEADHLAEAQHYLETRVGPGDALVCADSHSLLYLRQHATRLPGAILLLPGEPLHYYEGSLVIPPEWMHQGTALDSLAAARVRWWAVRTAHGGASSEPAAALLERAGGRIVLRHGESSVYEGPAGADTAGSEAAR
jgi:uncharacterized membrane protein